ncbi:hypothetical protein VNI00_008885 [Paramarasmius palmivorus]|uniref:Uncharacterized protein n=1 Tax=Paramarasmius palmivorus TaxID=297713 RepID=A0AAW0CP99_9AGAR
MVADAGVPPEQHPWLTEEGMAPLTKITSDPYATRPHLRSATPPPTESRLEATPLLQQPAYQAAKTISNTRSSAASDLYRIRHEHALASCFHHLPA